MHHLYPDSNKIIFFSVSQYLYIQLFLPNLHNYKVSHQREFTFYSQSREVKLIDYIPDYQDFLQDYFVAFLIKLFAFKVDIIATEEKNDSIKGLSGFISRFADEYMNIYLEISRKRKFDGIIQVK